jgi:predicted phosphodiesterase
MRVHIISDLHLEFGPISLSKTNADIVVLAGDIHMGEKGAHWARKQWPDIPIVYVLGNHEFYRDDLPGLTDRLRRLCQKTNIHLLENDRLDVEDVSFLGCTLWTDFELLGDSAAARAIAEQGWRIISR